MTADKPTIVVALSAVMDEVQAVRKADRNQSQNFNFRGIDAVVNAVGPALRKHGVVAVPVNVQPTFESYQSKQGASMRNCTVAITWRFYGPAGDFIEAQTLGEAADAGDKSVAKAHSVAYRILLLQALCIPTDEPDPDSSAHERAQPAPPDVRPRVRAEIKAAGAQRGWDIPKLSDDFAAWSQGESILEADLPTLEKYLAFLQEQA
jgi:hypothetical protein